MYGAGSPNNPYVVASTNEAIDIGVVVEKDNVSKVALASTLDFRGAGVTVTAGGPTEAVVTIAGGGGTGGSGDTIPPGSMMMYGGIVAPAGWLLCDGTSYQVVNYSNLWAAIGDRFGGDGGANFNVPNIGDQFPIGASPSKPVGNAGRGGSASKGIGVGNLPPHSHTIQHYHTVAAEYASNTNVSGGTYVRVTDINNTTGGTGTNISPATSNPSSANSGIVGSGVPIDVMPPYIPLTFIIKV